MSRNQQTTSADPSKDLRLLPPFDRRPWDFHQQDQPIHTSKSELDGVRDKKAAVTAALGFAGGDAFVNYLIEDDASLWYPTDETWSIGDEV